MGQLNCQYLFLIRQNIPLTAYHMKPTGSVIMRAQGDTIVRTSRDYDPQKIDSELQKIESYVQSIENSTLPGLKSKMALSEYLL